MKKTLLTIAAVMVGISLAVGTGAIAAGKERKARVAGDQSVTVAQSRYSDKELAAKRPQMQRLIPKKR